MQSYVHARVCVCGDMWCGLVSLCLRGDMSMHVCVVICGAALCPCTCVRVCGDMWCGLMSMHVCVVICGAVLCPCTCVCVSVW